MSEPIYLDWNASTPPLKEVADAMAIALREAWANPASIHLAGRTARAKVEEARAAIAELADVDPRDVVLTSGGTEANNLALRSMFPSGTCRTLITSRLEHPSVSKVAEALELEGRAKVRWLSVTREGVVDLADAERALAEPDVALVALQAVNHETGVVQPVAELLRLAGLSPVSKNVQVHVDAVQAFGKLEETGRGAYTRSMAAHKMRGPKGIGALLLREGTKIEPVLLGGSQERGVRPGTVDPVAAAGFAVAARFALRAFERATRVRALRDRFERDVRALVPGAVVNGGGLRAPHVTNLYVPSWNGAELVAALDLEGVCISSGSACSAGTVEPSPVLLAMFNRNRATHSVRISMGEATTDADVDFALASLARVIARAR